MGELFTTISDFFSDIQQGFTTPLKEEEQIIGLLSIIVKRFFFIILFIIIILFYQFWSINFFSIVDIKEGTKEEYIITNNEMIMANGNTKIEQETKEEESKCSSSNTLPVLSQKINNKNTNIRKKNLNAKGKKKRKEECINTITNEKVKPDEQEDCVDVETIPRDEVPGI